MLNLAEKALTYLCDKLECGLPLRKCDLIGVPLDGLGMENFGLLTFRGPTYFLVDEDTPIDLRQRISRYVLFFAKVCLVSTLTPPMILGLSYTKLFISGLVIW